MQQIIWPNHRVVSNCRRNKLLRLVTGRQMITVNTVTNKISCCSTNLKHADTQTRYYTYICG